MSSTQSKRDPEERLPSESATSKVAERALDVLLCLMDADEELGVSEIARRVDIDKSRVHRFLTALKRKGFVIDSPRSRKYSLGFRALELSRAISRQIELENQAQPFLRQLRDEIGETAGLAMRVGNRRIMIAQAESRLEIRQTFPLYEPLPLHLGAASKVLLAFRDEVDRDAILTSSVSAGPSRSTTEINALLAELELVRRRGWATSLGERVLSSRSIATPVWTWWGDVLALVISGPSGRFGEDEVAQAIPVLKRVAASFTRQLNGDEFATAFPEEKAS